MLGETPSVHNVFFCNFQAYKRFNGKLFGGFRMSAAFVINRDVQEEEEDFHRPVFKSVNRIKHNYKWAGKKRTLLKW